MKSAFLNLIAAAVMGFVPMALSAQVPAYVPTDGLVGWWPFNGNANDESGNGNDGVVNGATLVSDRNGNIENAYEFDGFTNHIEIQHSSSINCSEVSISIWFNAADYVGELNQNELVSKREYDGWGNSYEIGLGKDPNYCWANSNCENAIYTNYTTNNSNYTLAFNSNSLLLTSVWNHLTYVHTNQTVMLYLNGLPVLTTASNGILPTLNNLPLWFGARPGGGGRCFFNGMLDDIAMYNRALTEQEIQNLYGGTPPVACTALPANLQNGLVGYWPFCGNANDESGNGNDGVVNGATLTEDRFGNVYGAYDFNSEGSRIELPITSVINGANELTISHSFYLSELEGGGTFGNWYYYASGGGPIGLILGVSSGYLFAAVNGGQDIVSYQSISLQEWNHYTFVFDGNSSEKIKLYLNGVLQNIETLNTNIPFPEALGSQAVDTYLGGRQCENFQPWCFNGLSPSFKGLLDDIAIWNRALTPEEVQELYTGTTPTPAPCVALPANLQEGIVGYWPFCGNANDESGNGNNGVVNGATLTEDRFGNANAAYGFDGTNSFIQYEADNLPTSTRSVSAWFYSTNIGEGPSGRAILGYGGQSCGQSWNMHLDNAGSPQGPNSYEVNTHCNVFSITSNYGADAPNGAWHHWVAVTSSLGTQFYVDGELVSTDPAFINNTVVAGKDFCIGAYTNTNGVGALLTDPNNTPWNGSLDDIAIWNRALTPEEVQELYTLDACTFTVYDTLTVENIINVYDTLTIENIVDIYDTTYINVEVYDTLTVENIINVYDTLTIENIVDIYDTTYINVEVYDTLTVENIINVYDTLTIENIVEVYDTLTVENVIDVFDTTTVVETVVVFDTLTVENVIDVFDTTTVVETVVVFDTLTVENVIDVYDTTYVTVTDTLIIDIPSGLGGTILNTLLLYPNPTSDQLTISYGNFAAMAGYSLSIFDNGGSTVHQATITQAQETLDITQWSAGVYQVVVYNAGGVPVETRQIVIQ